MTFRMLHASLEKASESRTCIDNPSQTFVVFRDSRLVDTTTSYQIVPFPRRICQRFCIIFYSTDTYTYRACPYSIDFESTRHSMELDYPRYAIMYKRTVKRRISSEFGDKFVRRYPL